MATRGRGWIAAVAALGVAGVMVWSPAGNSARSAFLISKIEATFSEFDKATTYRVTPGADGVSPFTYAWTLTITKPDGQVDPAKEVDPGCNNHGVLSGTDDTFVWHHGNTGDATHDDGCNHDLQGKWGHQGLITVNVTDASGNSCSTTYKGTFASDANASLGQDPTSDVQCHTAGTPPPPPAPPPPPPKCKCLLLTARVVPSSLKLKVGTYQTNGVEHEASWREFTFVVHWVLNCSKGTGGCNGNLSVQEPARGAFNFSWQQPPSVTRDFEIFRIRCKGACGDVRDGGQKVRLDGRPGGGGETSELAKRWRNASFKFLIKRACQGKKLKSIKIVIALDATGHKIDFAKSKLG